MGRFGNEYLAESVGYNNGHARGINDGLNIGEKKGYSDGWNAAVSQANQVINEKDQEIARLSDEVRKGNASIKYLKANLEKAQHVSELYHTERDEFVELHEQEKAKRERLQYLVNLAREHGVDFASFDR